MVWSVSMPAMVTSLSMHVSIHTHTHTCSCVGKGYLNTWTRPPFPLLIQDHGKLEGITCDTHSNNGWAVGTQLIERFSQSNRFILNWNKEPVEKMVINGLAKNTTECELRGASFPSLISLSIHCITVFNPSTRGALPNESHTGSQNHPHPYHAGGCCVLPSSAIRLPGTVLLQHSAMNLTIAGLIPGVLRVLTWHQSQVVVPSSVICSWPTKVLMGIKSNTSSIESRFKLK